MILLYIVLIVYILAVNFYSFLYVFARQKTETGSDRPNLLEAPIKDTPHEAPTQSRATESLKKPRSSPTTTKAQTPHETVGNKESESRKEQKPSITKIFAPTAVDGFDWKLLLCGALGGAITIYVCMFVFKYKLNDLLLMIVMPILTAVNGYFWFLLFSSRFFIGV